MTTDTERFEELMLAAIVKAVAIPYELMAQDYQMAQRARWVARWRAAQVADALGRWVSELEPVTVWCSSTGAFLGLTHADQPFGGHPHLHVRARWPQ